MNAKVYATSDTAATWKQIDWQKAEAYVKELKNSIVKAHLESRHSKVKSLQVSVDSFFLRQSISRQETYRK